MKGEYDERVEDWYARRAEWEMARAREMERQGGGGEGVPPGGLRGGEGLKVEEGDEEMAGGRGGFTAVNG